MQPQTRIIHGGGGIGHDPTGAVTPPIYQVSTYRQDGLGRHRGYEYSRTGNPTRTVLEDLAAELEGGTRGFAFASGMAAISTVLMLLDGGDHLVVGDDVYGGTYRVITKVFNRLGIRATFVDTTDPERVARAVEDRTRALFIETPSNPLLNVTDLALMGQLCRKHGLLYIVDNTFLSPYFQKPIGCGADIVVHSATKYLGGHSDVVLGLAVVRDAELGDRLHFLQNAVGAVAGPQDSWLVARGIRTLALRMEQHARGAAAVARFLEAHPAVRKVYYPGLPSHPGHELSNKQTSGHGGMLSFEVADGKTAQRLVEATQLFTLAESLGGVESLISVPAKMTHASVPQARREQLGIRDGLIRLSVGLEDPDDLVEDLKRALSAASSENLTGGTL